MILLLVTLRETGHLEDSSTIKLPVIWLDHFSYCAKVSQNCEISSPAFLQALDMGTSQENT